MVYFDTSRSELLKYPAYMIFGTVYHEMGHLAPVTRPGKKINNYYNPKPQIAAKASLVLKPVNLLVKEDGMAFFISFGVNSIT